MLAKAIWAAWKLRRKRWYKRFPFLPLPEIAYLDVAQEGGNIFSYSQFFLVFFFFEREQVKKYLAWRDEVKRLKS